MKIFLPGLSKQLNFLRKNLPVKPTSILIIGSSSEFIAVSLSEKYKCKTELIVEDYESLMNSKLILGKDTNVNLRMMNYDSTDFAKEEFDLIYAQASISTSNRNKIIKEIKRILKPEGHLCVGEITALSNNIPVFIKDVFNSSDLLPQFSETITNYYQERNFNILFHQNFSDTLREYYTEASNYLRSAEMKLDEKEKSYYKKLLSKISHESNVYLKLGGEKYIGFAMLLLKKGQ